MLYAKAALIAKASPTLSGWVVSKLLCRQKRNLKLWHVSSVLASYLCLLRLEYDELSQIENPFERVESSNSFTRELVVELECQGCRRRPGWMLTWQGASKPIKACWKSRNLSHSRRRILVFACWSTLTKHTVNPETVFISQICWKVLLIKWENVFGGCVKTHLL